MNNLNPYVSINVPMYNREKYIGACLDSLLNQTYDNFEIVVLDDGSTDGSVDVVMSYKDPRIKYFRNDVNSGISFTRNRLVSLSGGELIAVLDSDDIAMPDRLRLQVNKFLNDPQLSLVAGKVKVIDEEGKETGQIWGTPMLADVCEAKLPFENTILHSTVMARKSFLEAIPYDARFNGTEDYDVWLRGSSEGFKYEVIEEVMAQYRVHGGGVTFEASAKIKGYIEELISNHWTRLLGNPVSERETLALCQLLYGRNSALEDPETCFSLLHRLYEIKVVNNNQNEHWLRVINLWWRIAIYRLNRFTPRNFFLLRSPMLRALPSREKASLLFKCIMFKRNVLIKS